MCCHHREKPKYKVRIGGAEPKKKLLYMQNVLFMSTQAKLSMPVEKREEKTNRGHSVVVAMKTMPRKYDQ